MPFLSKTVESGTYQVSIYSNQINSAGEYIIPRDAKAGLEIELNEECGVWGRLRDNNTPECCEYNNCLQLDVFVCCGDCKPSPITMLFKACVTGEKKFGEKVYVDNTSEDPCSNTYNTDGVGKVVGHIMDFGVENSKKEVWVGF